MKPTEIIIADAKRNGYNPAPLLQAIGEVMSKKVAFLLQAGDSVFVLRRLPDNAAEMHVFTAEEPEQFIQSVQQFIAEVQSSDLQKLYGNTKNADILEVFKDLGIDVMPSDIPLFDWMVEV